MSKVVYGGGRAAVKSPLEAFLAERNAALRTLDMDYARKLFPRALSDEVLLIGMHKARYHCTQIEPELRHASAAWLRERGYTGVGEPILPEGQLPEGA